MKVLKLRKAKGLTQGQLAELCDTTQQQIAKIETGIVDPKLSTLRKLADALDCELPSLFWTRDEFLETIAEVIEKYEINLARVSLFDLNSICDKEGNLPPFHPFWESVKINKATKSIHIAKKGTLR